MSEEMWCKSRAHHPEVPGPDRWDTEPNGDRTCSFCGSLHPEDFERLVAAAADQTSDVRIERSDKGYKWYVRQPGVANASEGGIKFYTWHVQSDEWAARVNKILPNAVHASAVKFEIIMQDITEEWHQDRSLKSGDGRHQGGSEDA